MPIADHYCLSTNSAPEPVSRTVWTFTCYTSNEPYWHSHPYWCPAAPVLKLRCGRWQSEDSRKVLDRRDSRFVVTSHSRRLHQWATSVVRRPVDNKPRAVVVHQPAWSARRWKSLT